MDLDSMKYTEMRNLAKELGLKANMKGDTEVADSSAPSGARLAKKRKVSSAKDCDKTVPEPPDSHGGTGQHYVLVYGTKCAAAVWFLFFLLNVILTCHLAFFLYFKYFKKLHEAHFNKMESIDSYVQRKAKQMEMYRDSVKELKVLKSFFLFCSFKIHLLLRDFQTKLSCTKLMAKPKQCLTAPPNKPAGKEDAPFRPSVLSTRRINVRFSEATHDNEYKRSLVKTPARLSPCVTSSTPLKKPNIVKTLSTTKTPGPFVFTGNTSTSATPGTQKKPTFDLKASLSRPLAYKPHKGKLKPFGEMKENTMINNLTTNSHQKNYKQHQVQTRADRRARRMEDRKQKKESMLGARRGLVMS
uniref:Nucleolar and spindle associated protein 1 n=1 Tax=Monopterus albus TaxID=43700 RepID=A0A3Q3KAD1_MONAL